LHQIPAAVLVYGPDGRVVLSNRAARQLLGLSAERVRGQTFAALCNGLLREDGTVLSWEESPEARLLRSGERFTDLVIGIDCLEPGVIRWVRADAVPVTGSDGALEHVVIMLVDVTARKQAEERLRASEERFRLLAETVQDVFMICKPEGYAPVYVSPAYEKIWGRSIVGLYQCPTSWLDAVDARDQRRLVTQRGHADGEWDVEYRIHRGDGSIRWIRERGFAVREPAGRPGLWVAVASDITGQKRAQEALAREKGRAENYLAIAGSIIVALDSRHRVSYINQAGCKALGYTSEELVDQDWIALVIPPEDQPVVGEVFHRLMAGETTGLEHVEDHQVVRRDGRRRWVVWHNTLVRDEDGRIVGTLSSGEDVTERREAEQRVKASLEEKEVLLREIHHRVKNNLQVISSLLTLEAHHHAGESSAQLFADTQSRIRAMALVHDKLYQSDNLALIELGAYIRDLAAGLKEVNASRQRDVRVVVDAENIALSVDAAMPCGLMLNELLTNAFKYAFPDGRCGEIRVDARHLDGGQIQISVSDNGVGLPAEIGLDSSGTLGLQLVRTIAGQLGGGVTVERGSGTRFDITFPLGYGRRAEVVQQAANPLPGDQPVERSGHD